MNIKTSCITVRDANNGKKYYMFSRANPAENCITNIRLYSIKSQILSFNSVIHQENMSV